MSKNVFYMHIYMLKISIFLILIETYILHLVIVNQVWEIRFQDEFGKNILKKKSCDPKCVFQALFHVKKFDFFNLVLILLFTLGNSKSSMGNSIAGRIG